MAVAVRSVATGKAVEMWDVFISYASPDRYHAEDLADQLTNEGWKVYFDRNELEPGDRWDDELEAVRSARIVAVLLSEHSDRAHFQREEIHLAIELARQGELQVVPVYLEGKPSEPAPWEFGLRSYQRIDWRERGVLGTARSLAGRLYENAGDREVDFQCARQSVGDVLHGAALRIDRTRQWDPLRRICSSEQSAFFLLHGLRRQNLDLFVSRIWHYLGPECGHHYHSVIVPRRIEFATPRSAEAWENNLRHGLAREGSGQGTADDLLRETARHSPVFLVVSRVPISYHEEGRNGGLDDVEIEALEGFLSDRFPNLLGSAAKGRHPVHALVATHYDHEDDSLVERLDEKAVLGCQRHGVHYRKLPQLKPLEWDDVEHYLESFAKRPPRKLMREVKQAFEQLDRDDMEFREVLDLLANMLD